MIRILTILLIMMSFNSANAQEAGGEGAYVKPNLSELHRAVFYKKLDAIEFLAQNGADVNALAGNKNTPLHMAALRGETEAAAILLKYGADPYIENAAGVNSLTMARSYGNHDIVDLIENN